MWVSWGVLVTYLTWGSEAYEAGLRREAVIVAVNKTPVRSLSEVKRLLGEQDGTPKLVRTARGREQRWLVINPR